MKKLILTATLAAFAITTAAWAAPIKNEQPGDLKANINYGFDQKEGHGDAKSRFTGGDVTYVINDRWNLEYINNYTKGNDSHKINENYLVGNYRLTEYLSAYAGASYIKTDTYDSKNPTATRSASAVRSPLLNAGRALRPSVSVMTPIPTKSASATTLRRSGTLISNIAAAASMSTTTMTTSAAGRSVWAISSNVDNLSACPV